MKQSCIRHPEKERLLVIREWQLEACKNEDGKSNACAAALLSFFEYWHNIKLEQAGQARMANKVSRQHGEPESQNESLWQWHTEEELEHGIMIYKRSTIREAVRFLAGKGFITVSDNPNPKYRFDRTKHFLFHPDTVNAWLRAHPLKVTDGAVESTDCHPLEIRDGAVENSGAIPETTSEIPNEKEIDPSLERFWAMTLDYATLPDKLAREVRTMEPRSWEAGVLTLQAPAYLARRRVLPDELLRLPAPVAPVALCEVRVVNGA